MSFVSPPGARGTVGFLGPWMQVDAAEPSGQQHLVDVSDQKVEVDVADPLGVAEVGVAVGATDGHPLVGPPDQVRPEQHAVPLVLEALGGVDAADLTKAPLVAGPQRGRGSVTDGAVAIE